MRAKKDIKATGVKVQTKRPSVSNQAKIDAKDPSPFDFSGKAFSFVNQSYYLPFLPPLDDFARNILEARLISVTHNACVTTKKDYCAGKGFHDAKGTKLPKLFTDWLKSMNLKNQSATKLNKIAFESHFTWGNTPIEVVRFTVGGKKKMFVYVHTFLEWRLGVPNADDIVETAIQSKLFYRNGIVTQEDINKGKQLPIYNPMKTETENWKKDPVTGTERTLIWYKNDVAGIPHYGLASAIASMINQILEYKGARFNMDNFDNNLVVASILALKGNLSDDEANRIGKKIINQHSGDGKRGRTVVVASEEGIESSDFHKLDTKTDGSYNESDDKWSQKIVLANQWDSILAGIVSPSTLGKGSGFLTKILEFKLNSVIRPAQEDLMNEVWTHIFTMWSEWFKIPLEQFEIEIQNAIDISGLTDVDITEAVQVNEVRKAKGLQEDLKKKGVYMKGKAAGTADPKEGGDGV